MSHRVEAAPDREEEVVEVKNEDEGTVDLGSEDGDGGNSLPTLPAAGSNLPEEEEEEENEDEEEEEEDELALTIREFNEQFVYHTTPPSPFPNYPSPLPHLPLPSGSPNISTLLNRNDQSAPQNTTVQDNAEQLGNQQSPETDQPVAVAEIAVNGGTVVNTAATAVAVHQSTQTDDQRDTANERRRPYRCTVCPKAFIFSSSLQYHRQHDHPPLPTTLTNRQFNEQFVYHTTPLSPSLNHPSPPRLCLLLLTRATFDTLVLNRIDQSVPTSTAVHDNAEQPGNQQSIETDQPVAVAEIAVNGGTVVNTAATAVAVHQSTETDDLRDTDNERRRRPHRCTVCSKAFTQKGHLKVHIRTHTNERPFQCDQCQKSFTTHGNLTSHLRTHSDERPFQCEKCGLRFKQKVVLTVHLRLHTGQRSYQCTVCPKAYTCSSSLTNHRQHAHPPPNPLSQLNQSQ